MLYRVSRDGQTYGPYTHEDLERYVASGNVLPTDMALAEGATEWVPVAQVLGGAAAASGGFAPTGAPIAPSYPPAAVPEFGAGVPAYPDPPNMNWGLVLVLSIFTCSVFMFVWNIILGAWMKRVQPRSTAIYFYIAAIVLLCISGATGRSMHVQASGYFYYYYQHPLRNLAGLALWIVRLIARFTLRSNLEEHYNTVEPIGLRLSGVMTFFFGGLYFQHHLNRINELKRMARYRGAAI